MTMFDSLGSIVANCIAIVIIIFVSIFGGLILSRVGNLPHECIIDCNSQIEITVEQQAGPDCGTSCDEACSKWWDCPEIVFKDLTRLPQWDPTHDFLDLNRACILGQCTYYFNAYIYNITIPGTLDVLGIAQLTYDSFNRSNFTETSSALIFPFSFNVPSWYGPASDSNHPLNFLCRNLMSSNQTELNIDCVRVQTETRYISSNSLRIVCRYWFNCLNTIDNFLTNESIVFPIAPYV